MRVTLFLVLALLTVLPATAQQICDQQARRLLQLLGIRDQRHEILQENLATYLFNLREPVPEASLISLDAFTLWLNGKEAEYRQRRTFGSNELGRWPSKFYTNLAHPYSDEETGLHFQRIVRYFRNQCRILSLAQPGYARQYFAFGSMVQGRFGALSDLDFFVNDPHGDKSSKQFIVRGYCRGFAFDEASFQERKDLYLAGRQNVMMGGPVYELSGAEPWTQLRVMLMQRMADRGLEVKESAAGWKVRRLAYPARKYDDPSSDEERNRPI